MAGRLSSRPFLGGDGAAKNQPRLSQFPPDHPSRDEIAQCGGDAAKKGKGERRADEFFGHGKAAAA